MSFSASAGLPAGVLFDMDGLLLDSEEVWFATETDMMAEYGVPWGVTDHQTLVGTASKVSSAYIAAKVNAFGHSVTAPEVADEMHSRMAVRLKEPQTLRPGAARLIAEVDAAGIPRALVSSTIRTLIEAALSGIAPITFDVVVAGDDVAHNKPHPEPYLLGAHLLGLDPADCVALEDSPSGADSASAAGCWVVGVPSVTPIEPIDRRIVVSSLEDIDLARLRALFT
jgi:HAD superfamily hydrolase (TIGR01509 family)